MIEDAFNQKKLNVEIDGNYIVNFEEQIYYKKYDSHEHFPIKRDHIDRYRGVDHIRKERFLLSVTISDKTLTASSPKKQQQQDNDLALLRQYGYFAATYSNLELSDKHRTIADIVEEAAQGIINEGTAYGKLHEAEWLAKRLYDVKNSGVTMITESFETPLDIDQMCIYLYTKESFWYKLLNHTLLDPETITRNQIKTLGPFCYLLERILLK
ncbi:unnamed protein product [Rotaria magnacalcarata]|uniref:Uncharacterized protein n=1 Tax=Rotaria magnacalcarata TaxID=392030 RepID=A0A816NP12_9BILA|nr:unnamed protein product [Rotaria magnacalcarata]